MEGKGTNMNPYVYKRKRLSLSSSNSVKTVSLTNLVKEVFSGQISSAIAFAAIAFGAMSVLTLSLTTEAEIGRLYGQAPVFESQMVKRTAMQVRSFAQITENRPSLVLGETTYPKSLITSSWNSTIKIYAQPIEYVSSSQKWLYDITWSRTRNAVGSIYINGEEGSSSAAQTGTVRVDASASSRVKVEFYSQANKKGTLLVRKYFTVKDKLGDDSVACTHVAKLCEDGVTFVTKTGPKCEFAPCPIVDKIICPSMMCAAPPEGYHYEKDSTILCSCGVLVKDGSLGEKSTTTNVSFRYLKVNTVVSRSWVAWREIEIYDTLGNKIKPVKATAQYTWRNYPQDSQDHSPAMVIDGKVNTAWNAGETAPNCNWFSVAWSDRMGCGQGNQSAWVQVDLGSAQKVGKIRLLPENSPDPAYAIHQLQISDDEKTYKTIEEFKDNIKSNTWLQYPGEVYSSAPQVNFTVNGQTETTVKVGEKIKYAWNANYADSATIQISEADDSTLSKQGRTEDYLCNQSTYKNAQLIHPFGVGVDRANLSGQSEIQAQGCYAGKVIVLTYTAKQRNGGAVATKTVKVKVNGVAPVSSPVVTTPTTPTFSAPAIKLTVNGQPGVTVNPGDKVKYEWGITDYNYDKITSTYTADRAEYCKNVSNGVSKTWIANTAQGSQELYIDECQSGTTYTMTYTAKNSAGALPDLTAIITVKVNNAQGPYFKANGVTNLTAKVGDTIHYSWISTGSAFSSSYTTDKADTCSGGSAGPGIKYPWVANTVAGSTDAVVQACQAGVTYYINYLATCAGCGTISQDITVKVNP